MGSSNKMLVENGDTSLPVSKESNGWTEQMMWLTLQFWCNQLWIACIMNILFAIVKQAFSLLHGCLVKSVEWSWQRNKFVFTQYWVINHLTNWGLVMPYGDMVWVNIGPGNGLLPDGTNPLPEPMLTCHQWCSVAFTWDKFNWTYSRI